MAYAFEYAMMYDIVMRSYIKKGNEKLGAFSFGCGSMLDAWSMAYARALLMKEDTKYENCELFYRGIDAEEWEEYFVQPKNIPSENAPENIFENIRFEEADVNNFIKDRFIGSKNKSVFYNILMLPKILNELKPAEIRKMLEGLSKVNFDRDEYYICVSHSRCNVNDGIKEECAEKGLGIIRDMVETINANGEFEVCSDIAEMTGASYDGFRNAWLGGGRDRLVSVPVPEKYNSYRCYTFTSSPMETRNERSRNLCPTRIAALNNDFRCQEIEEYIKGLQGRFSEKDDVRACQVSRVSNIIFQIVRLKRKNKSR